MRYRDRLPQLDDGGLFLTDGGIETVLIFHEVSSGLGLVLESPTWRASLRWADEVRARDRAGRHRRLRRTAR